MMVLLTSDQFKKLVVDLHDLTMDHVMRLESLDLKSEYIEQFAPGKEFTSCMFVEERYESDGAVFVSVEVYSDDVTLDKKAVVNDVADWLGNL